MKLYTVAHLFCGIGGGAAGFIPARFRVDGVDGRFVTTGGVDADADALRAFEALTGAPGVHLDLFSEEDYRAFHGHPPPAGWREVQPADLRLALGPAPDVLYTSPPCVGMSRLVHPERARGGRYRAVNQLTVRGIMLALEAWADRPPRIILLENVPGLAEPRGEHLLRQIVAALEGADYSVTWHVECLGELGGLGARRQRLKLVARHRPQVPALLFRPRSRGLRSCGEVLGNLPLPHDPCAGPMHTLGQHSWLTWLRLALIPPGRDWRALKDLAVVEGGLRDFALAPMTWRPGSLGVARWSDALGTITGEPGPTNGAFSIADPRAPWMDRGRAYSGAYGVIPWDEAAGTVMACGDVQAAPAAVADPRVGQGYSNKLKVCQWGEPGQVIIGAACPGAGGIAIADPRSPGAPQEIHAIGVPEPQDRGVWMIRSPHGGAWHRPITRLEAAVLQGFDPRDMGCGDGSRMVLPGTSATRWQKWIGNAVPVPAAQVIAETCGRCLLGADLGEQTFLYGPDLVPWARPVAASLGVDL